MIYDLQAFGPQFAFLKWRRAHEGRVAVRIPDAGVFHLRPHTSDASVIREIFGRQEYSLSDRPHEAILRRRYEALLAKGVTPLIIDAGANIGVASVWFARKFPQARIVAIEPEPENAKTCSLNVAPYQQIRVLEAALGATSGRVALSEPGEGAEWGFQSERSDDGILLVTIPEIVAQEPGSELFIAKIDIEGFESDLFSANLEWLDDTDLLIVETHDWLHPGRGLSASLQQAMGVRQFDILLKGENLFYVNRERVPFEPVP